ncbi:MaoC/PaaZ C-terminal domain-containing protein [Aneurinibacillus tyrosinisolvens]|uniref:MaoC/PaaZ C-terminal domain-containing protein n=1 Tax=Aneurinibacillus tyrosinisolvens TaxID=1443435 RepID=UPI000699C65E|nr:MaoC/PaaZ C-terminal domain-containing protein [Aneurinibacillus tyrosinisolvens]
MYFEDFHVGQRFNLAPITMTAEEINEFARRYDPQPIHIDAHFSENGPFKGIIASGFHTASVVWGKWIESERFGTEIIGGAGLDFLNWPAPVRPGDQLFTEIEVMNTKLSSRGKRGLVTLRFTVLNQEETLVLTTQCNVFLKTKQSGSF